MLAWHSTPYPKIMKKILLFIAAIAPLFAQDIYTTGTPATGANVTTADLIQFRDVSVTTGAGKVKPMPIGELVNVPGLFSAVPNGTFSLAKISQSGATTGQVPKWNGTAWAPAADAGEPVTSGAVISALGYTPADAAAVASSSAQEVAFYDDFSRYPNATTIPNDGTFFPMIGNAWKRSFNIPSGSNTPIVTGRRFGASNSQLWYIGSSVATEGDEFSFGCEMIWLPTGGGATPPAYNMSFGRNAMLVGANDIVPASVMHINFNVAAISDLNYYPVPFTANGTTNICTAVGHRMITGDPVLLSGGDIASIVAAGTYYVIRLTDDTFQLASTYNNSIAGASLDIGNYSGAAANYQPKDITCLNRTPGGSGTLFKEPLDLAHNQEGVQFAIVVELKGEILTVTRSGVGSIVYRIPSLARWAGDQMYFWYEGTGLNDTGTQSLYHAISKAWAGAPKLDRQFLAEQNIDREDIVGGEANSSSVTVRATRHASPNSSATAKIMGGSSATVLTATPTGHVVIGDTTTPYTAGATSFPALQLAGNRAHGTFVMSDTFAQNANKQAGFTIPHYNITSWGSVPLFSATTNSTANTVNIGGGVTGAAAITQLNFYTGANNTTTVGTVRFSIDSAGRLKTTLTDYADDAAAGAGGLTAGMLYQTSGTVKIKQ